MTQKIKDRPGTAQEIPREQIIEQAKNYPMAKLRVKRQNVRGHWLTVTSGIQFNTIDLLDMDSWLTEKAGGGNYLCEATDPQNPSRAICPPFYVRIEGPEKAFTVPGHDDQSGGYPGPQPHYIPAPGPTMRGGRSDDPRRYMGQTPDQIAKHGWDQADMERRELRAERERDRKEYEKRLEQQRIETEQLRREMAQRDAEHKERMMQMQIEAMKTQSAPKIDWASMLAAAAPIVVAVIDASKTRTVEAFAQQTALQSQSKDMMLALTQRPSGTEDLIKTLGLVIPAVIPLAQSYLENNSPKHQNDLYTTMHDQMLTQATMTAQLIRDFADMQGDSPPPWMGLVQELAAGAERMVDAMAQKPPGGQPPQQHAGGGTVRVRPQQREEEDEVEVVDGAPAEAVQASQRAEHERLNQAMAAVPDYMQMQEWANIVHHAMSENDRLIRDLVGAMIELVIAQQPDVPVFQNLLAFDGEAVNDAILKHIPISDGYRAKLEEAFAAAVRSMRAGAPEGAQRPASNGSANGKRQPSGMLVGDEIPRAARKVH